MTKLNERLLSAWRQRWSDSESQPIQTDEETAAIRTADDSIGAPSDASLADSILSESVFSDSFLPASPRPHNEAESELVEQARLDPTAFGVLYELYVERIYAYCFHRVGNAQEAEDLTARTFYRALDRLDTYEDRGLPFSAWLFRIAHNLVANWHRDRSRRRFLSLDKLWSHSRDGDTPEQQVEEEERHAALWSAIDRLPEERRSLLLLKFGAHLSNLEIGELMNKSESAIKSLYFRTLATLRADLRARGWGQPDLLAEPEQDDFLEGAERKVQGPPG